MLDFNWLPLIEMIVLSVSTYFTAVISAIIGMAGGITLLSIMTFFLPLQQLIPIHGTIQFVSNSTRTYLLRKEVNKKIFWPFAIGVPFGAIPATLFLAKMEDRTIPLLLIAGLIFYTLFKPKKLPPLVIKERNFFFVGLMVGVLSPLVGATGPFIAPFFLRPDLNKNQLVATKASVQIVGHLIKFPAFFYLGFSYTEWFPVIAILCLCAVLGTKYGVKLLHKIPEKTFFMIFKSLLFIAALRLIYKALIA